MSTLLSGVLLAALGVSQGAAAGAEAAAGGAEQGDGPAPPAGAAEEPPAALEGAAGEPPAALEEAPEELAETPKADGPAAKEPAIGVGLAAHLGAGWLPTVRGTNAILERQGFDTVPEISPLLGLSLTMYVNHCVLLADFQQLLMTDPEGNTGAETYLITLSTGYSMTPWDDFMVYPYLGIGVGVHTLTAGRAATSAATFEGSLRHTLAPVRLRGSGLLLSSGLALDWWWARVMSHPGKGLFLGLRAGVVAGVADFGWNLEDSGADGFELEAGPPPPVSGFIGDAHFGLRL